MKFRRLLCLLLTLITLLSISGCGGSGGAGLNGSISLSVQTDGGLIKATATYSNPDATKRLIGTPISFYAVIGDVSYSLGTENTNDSGTVTVGFPTPAFNGTQNITIIAKTGELEDFDTVTMTGRSITMTPPPNVSLSAVAGSAAQMDFSIAGTPNFVTISSPFAGESVSGRELNITYTVSSSTGSSSSLTVPATTTTSYAGIAPFPGATGKIAIPAVAGTEILTINWTVTDPATGLITFGTTTVTMTASAPAI